MPIGGKRHTQRKHHTVKNVKTVPELRRSFEYIESIGYNLCNKPHKESVSKFQAEWKKTFYRDLDSHAAEAYLNHLKSQKRRKSKKTRKMYGGSAPLDYTTRPGIYLTPGGIDRNSYPLTPKFVDSGFWNPEPAQQYDPVAGQTRYPTATPMGMGSNAWPAAFGMPFKGGSGSRKKRKLRGGMASLEQAFSQGSMAQGLMRPFPGNVPPSVGNDIQTAWNGQQLGQSPDPTQTRLNYQMAPNARPIAPLSISPINIAL